VVASVAIGEELVQVRIFGQLPYGGLELAPVPCEHCRVHKADEQHRDLVVPYIYHAFNSYFHIVRCYRLMLCYVHPLLYQSGIVLHKSDDAVVVLGVGVAHPSALYHFQRFQ